MTKSGRGKGPWKTATEITTECGAAKAQNDNSAVKRAHGLELQPGYYILQRVDNLADFVIADDERR